MCMSVVLQFVVTSQQIHFTTAKYGIHLHVQNAKLAPESISRTTVPLWCVQWSVCGSIMPAQHCRTTSGKSGFFLGNPVVKLLEMIIDQNFRPIRFQPTGNKLGFMTHIILHARQQRIWQKCIQNIKDHSSKTQWLALRITARRSQARDSLKGLWLSPTVQGHTSQLDQ